MVPVTPPVLSVAKGTSGSVPCVATSTPPVLTVATSTAKSPPPPPTTTTTTPYLLPRLFAANSKQAHYTSSLVEDEGKVPRS